MNKQNAVYRKIGNSDKSLVIYTHNDGFKKGAKFVINKIQGGKQ
jgi:hypothetical protein